MDVLINKKKSPEQKISNWLVSNSEQHIVKNHSDMSFESPIDLAELDAGYTENFNDKYSSYSRKYSEKIGVEEEWSFHEWLNASNSSDDSDPGRLVIDESYINEDLKSPNDKYSSYSRKYSEKIGVEEEWSCDEWLNASNSSDDSDPGRLVIDESYINEDLKSPNNNTNCIKEYNAIEVDNEKSTFSDICSVSVSRDSSDKTKSTMCKIVKDEDAESFIEKTYSDKYENRTKNKNSELSKLNIKSVTRSSNLSNRYNSLLHSEKRPTDITVEEKGKRKKEKVYSLNNSVKALDSSDSLDPDNNNLADIKRNTDTQEAEKLLQLSEPSNLPVDITCHKKINNNKEVRKRILSDKNPEICLSFLPGGTMQIDKRDFKSAGKKRPILQPIESISADAADAIKKLKIDLDLKQQLLAQNTSRILRGTSNDSVPIKQYDKCENHLEGLKIEYFPTRTGETNSTGKNHANMRSYRKILPANINFNSLIISMKEIYDLDSGKNKILATTQKSNSNIPGTSNSTNSRFGTIGNLLPIKRYKVMDLSLQKLILNSILNNSSSSNIQSIKMEDSKNAFYTYGRIQSGKFNYGTREIKIPIPHYGNLCVIEKHNNKETNKHQSSSGDQESNQRPPLQNATNVLISNVPGVLSYILPITGVISDSQSSIHNNTKSGIGIQLEKNDFKAKENIQPTTQRDKSSLLDNTKSTKKYYNCAKVPEKLSLVSNDSSTVGKLQATLPSNTPKQHSQATTKGTVPLEPKTTSSVSEEMYPCQTCGEPNQTMKYIRHCLEIGLSHLRLCYCFICHYDLLSSDSPNHHTLSLPPQDTVLKILRMEFVVRLVCTKCNLYFDKKLYKRNIVNCQNCSAPLFLQCSKCFKNHTEDNFDRHLKYTCSDKNQTGIKDNTSEQCINTDIIGQNLINDLKWN